MSVFVTCMVITAIITDITTYIIPNLLVVVILLCYPIIVLMAPVTPDWKMGLLFGGITFAAGFVLFAIKAMGGGDVKLLAVIALYTAKVSFLEFITITAILGGVLSLFLLAARPIAIYAYAKAGRSSSDIPRILTSGAPIPYGVAIGSAFIFLIWTGQITGIAL